MFIVAFCCWLCGSFTKKLFRKETFPRNPLFGRICLPDVLLEVVRKDGKVGSCALFYYDV